MDDNTAFSVGPNSRVEIREYISFSQNSRKALFNLITGKVRFDVKRKYDGRKNTFMVMTPSAVCGVRGTDFLTEYEADTKNTTVTTFHGVGEFGRAAANGNLVNPVRIAAGRTSKMGADGPPSAPVPVPKAQMERLRRSAPDESKDEMRKGHDKLDATKEHSSHH